MTTLNVKITMFGGGRQVNAWLLHKKYNPRMLPRRKYCLQLVGPPAVRRHRLRVPPMWPLIQLIVSNY